MSSWLRSLACLSVIFVLAGCDPNQDKDAKADKDKKEPSKPATHKVEKGPLKIETSLKGVFESEDMAEIALSPEAWNPQNGGILMVVKAVEHGAPVRKGDVVLQLDLTKIDQLLKDLEAERQLNELAQKLAEDELPVLDKFHQLDVAAAERAKKISDENLKRYVERERAYVEKKAKYDLKSAKNYLENAKEELKQLEKMYRSKDLTEETEEIILRRQRDAVERAAFYVEGEEMEYDYFQKFGLARIDERMHEVNTREALAWEKAKSLMPLNQRQKHLSLAKLKYERDKTTEKVFKLQKDRETLTVKAPMDGIAYYGKCVKGQFSNASGLASRLQKGQQLMPEEVIMTIVQPRPLFVRATVEEKELEDVKVGANGKVVPTAFPDLKLPATVKHVSTVPGPSGNFEARVSVELGKNGDPIKPGMNCTVKLTTSEKKDALTVPASAVFAEDGDEDSHYVYLLGKDNKPVKQAVEVGKKKDKVVEILKGLNEGQEILQEKPSKDKDKKTDEQPKKE